MNYALFVEYEGILLGNTQKFSQLSLTRLREKTTAKQILRFIFEDKITPIITPININTIAVIAMLKAIVSFNGIKYPNTIKSPK